MISPHPPSVGRRPLLVECLEPRRLMAFADVDTSFGVDGVGPQVRALAEQRDGKILATEGGVKRGSRLDRLNADGSFDTTFSLDGRVNFPSQIIAAKQTDDGRIVVAYTYRKIVDPQDFDKDVHGYGVARFFASGKLDRTFGNDGSNDLPFADATVGETEVADVEIAGDGSTYIGVSGDTFVIRVSETDPFTSMVIKFDADGRADRSFGTNGVATLPGVRRTGARDNFVRAIDSLQLTDNGKLVVAGTEVRFDTAKDPAYGIRNDLTAVSSYAARLTTGGREDTAFGSNGVFRSAKTLPDDDQYYYSGDGENEKLLRQSDGRLLLVTRTAGRPRVLTLSADGKAIESLGRAQRDSVGGSGRIQSAALLPNGDVAVTIEFNLYLFRRTADGFELQQPRLPATADGKKVDSGYYGENSLRVLRDGKLLTTSYFNVVRLRTDAVTPRQDDLPFARQNAISADASETSVPVLHAYYHDSRGGLKHKFRASSGQWDAVETIDAAVDAGTFVSAFDNAVAYTDGGRGDLKFAKRRANGTWKIETIDAGGSTGFYPSLVQADDKSLVVAYYDRTKGNLMLARKGRTGGWTRETVDAKGDVGRFAKATVRPDGRLAIAYATNTTGGVRLAEQRSAKRGGGWAFTDIATITGGRGGGVGGLDVGYFLTNTDAEANAPSVLQITVAYYDVGPGDLVVGYRASPTAKFRVLRETSTGDVGLDPHVTAASSVSFYDKTRNQIRGLNVVESETDGSVSLRNYAAPIVADAGPFSGPVIRSDRRGKSFEVDQQTYTPEYAWLDEDTGVLQVRDPV